MQPQMKMGKAREGGEGLVDDKYRQGYQMMRRKGVRRRI